MTLPAERRAASGIATLDELREHLQWAIELEHATRPPYLCALYSLDLFARPLCDGTHREIGFREEPTTEGAES
ncbi:ferritin-like protein [Actinomadura decatromicini]|uniref:ferritin-like protein n=1 Tax=Actinomadura decatromicini TaxID=2604572 RepID=UPI001CA34A9B|nr:ferritin-like protein [Actinomadura decatromicini]